MTTIRGGRRRRNRSPEQSLPASPPGRDHLALAALAAYAVALVWTVVVWHPTPTYGVETDLLGEFIPAARALLAGHPDPQHYLFRGFGYPALLAGASLATLGDFYLAALLLDVAAAIAAAWFSYSLFRDFLGRAAGRFVLVGLLVNPTFVRATVEGGSDMPAFALSIAATFLVLRRRSARALAVAGFLAGLAFVTRYNAATLILAACVILVGRRTAWIRIAAYGAGAAAPIAAWMLVNRALTGSAFTNQAYLNVAYAVYGQQVQWDLFWTDAARRFHSLGDVMRYDPGAFARGIAGNLATHWLADIRRLVPLWLGVFSVAGMLLWWGRPGWRDVLLHFGLSYLALSAVFYADRFFLYQAPFYLAGAATLLVSASLAGGNWRSRAFSTVQRYPGRPWRLAIVAALLLASGVQAVIGVRTLLADAPHEARRAGLLLRRLGPAGARVMARKPHVAYFARMDLVRFPAEGSLRDILRSAQARKIDYLFYSGMEANLRFDLSFLMDRDLNLPGLYQVSAESLSPGRGYVLYRFARAAPDSAALDSALARAFRRHADSHPRDAVALLNAAEQLRSLGRYREALEITERAERVRPGLPGTAALRANAHAALGEFEQARQEGELALRRGVDPVWGNVFLGQVEIQEGRYAEARRHLEVAVRLEPANAGYLELLGLAEFSAGDFPRAAESFERALRVAPGSLPARLYAARALRLTGQDERALAVIEAAGEGAGADPQLRALADSLRRGSR